MKKIFFFSMLLAALAFTGCRKDPQNGDNGKTVVKRIKTFTLSGDGWADVYQYSYDTEGRVVKVFREESKQWTLSYSGKTVTVKNAEGKDAYVLTLNDKGYCEKMEDEWGDIRTYTYDAAGHITQIKKGNDVKSNIKIEDGCVVSWSKWRAPQDGAPEVEVFKLHTYVSTKNVGNIFNIHSEATDPQRWMYETGLFGIASAYLCSSSQWDYSDAKATYTYDFDEDGYVIAEHKDYPDFPEEFAYTWEVVK